MVLREKWPVIGRHERAATWLQIWADLGRAPRTIDAYARGLTEYLLMCEREGVDPGTANRAHVAVFVRELTSRPGLRAANVVAIDSGAGLANATIQQRLVPVRLFYDFPARVNLCEAAFSKHHCVDVVSFSGRLIHAAVGSAGGSGGFRAKRSG